MTRLSYCKDAVIYEVILSELYVHPEKHTGKHEASVYPQMISLADKNVQNPP